MENNLHFLFKNKQKKSYFVEKYDIINMHGQMDGIRRLL